MTLQVIAPLDTDSLVRITASRNLDRTYRNRIRVPELLLSRSRLCSSVQPDSIATFAPLLSGSWLLFKGKSVFPRRNTSTRRHDRGDCRGRKRILTRSFSALCDSADFHWPVLVDTSRRPYHYFLIIAAVGAFQSPLTLILAPSHNT